MFMKKLSICMLIGMLAFGTAACGGKTVQEPILQESTEEPTAVTEETSEESAEEPSSAEETMEESTETPIENFVFTRDNMPRLDGSTSTVPLAVAACAELLGEAPEDVEGLIHFNKTTVAYWNLIRGDADILIVGEANQQVMDEKEKWNFEWEKEPFATDAFIFVVNQNNPVDSITIEQARKIYTGEITNWKELGGNDLEIVALQRNEGAGSQTLMEKHIMKGEPMMEAPKEYIAGTMGNLMEAVKSYDGTAGAIGYSVYYYAEEMKMAQGLKMLKLEGVEPNPETIRNETYPIINPKYVVIPADAGVNDSNRRMFNWLLSEEGQTLIAKEGYVSLLDVGTFPKTTTTVGTRLHEGYMGELKASDSYGTLIPYAGRRLMDDWPANSGCLYGLMTKDGVAVTDAVYSDWGFLHCARQVGQPLLVLRQGMPDGDRYTEKVVVATFDGSMVTDEEYIAVSSCAEGVLLYTANTITLMNPNGSIREVLTQAELGLSDDQWQQMMADVWDIQYIGGNWLKNYVGLVATDDGDGGLIFDLESREIKHLSRQEWFKWLDDYPRFDYPRPEAKEKGADCVIDMATGYLQADKYLIRETEAQPNGSPVLRYFRADGTPIPDAVVDSGKWYQSVSLINGIIEVVDLNTATYYDYDTLEVIFKAYLGYEAD